MLNSPVAGSIVTPSPLAPNVSAAPVKAEDMFKAWSPELRKCTTSGSGATRVGGAWRTTSGEVVAEATPAEFMALTVQASSARSSSGPGT